MRVLSPDGQVRRDERRPVELAPLSATKLADYVDADLLGNADPASTIAVFDLQVEGEAASRSVVYFKAAKDMRWPDPGVQATLSREGAAYVLQLRATRLARGLWVDFGALDAELSDNALTLLPGESLRLRVSSRAGLGALRRALRQRSVADPLVQRLFSKTP